MHERNITRGKTDAVRTLLDAIAEHTAGTARTASLVYAADGETETQRTDMRAIEAKARSIAARMQLLGMSGERALLMFPSGLDFIAAFVGCLYARVIAVPVAIPRKERIGWSALGGIAKNCQARFVITTADLRSLQAAATSDELPEMTWLTVSELAQASPVLCERPTLDASSVAFIQFTSGSTSVPKGVVVTHGNIVANLGMIAKAMNVTPSTVALSWLPLYHDMGLIGMVLTSLFTGNDLILMSPQHFLQRPMRWLSAISRYRVTISGAPDFAYRLCVQRARSLDLNLDLSCWKVAFVGSEPVRASTLQQFEDRFLSSGFSRAAFYPCYGMAETTLFVSGAQASTGPRTQTVDRAHLESGRAVSALPADTACSEIVSCGTPSEHLAVRIVDAQSRTPCPDGQIGEILVSGESISPGYWTVRGVRKLITTALTRLDGTTYLRSGDLGFMSEGQLFVTGRLKDLVIIRGRNLYPQDIEWTVARSHTALHGTNAAAFGIEVGGEEQLVIICEARTRRHDWDEVLTDVVENVSTAHGCRPWEIVLVSVGEIPRTSSGKTMRNACKQKYLARNLRTTATWCPRPSGACQHG